MEFLSLFSGVEAASAAFKPLGWNCVAVAEIAPFPCAVLAYRYPAIPNLGDVTEITKDQVRALGSLGLVIGGSPCQDFSLAGRRNGLKNEDGSSTRSGLVFDAIKIADWSGARWAIIENVFGILSSNSGQDFAAVVGEMAGCEFDVPRNGWKKSGFIAGPKGLVEWTVLDAQYHGLAQRRRRVFIVRDSGDWASRPPLFVDAHRLQGHAEPNRSSEKDGFTKPVVGAECSRHDWKGDFRVNATKSSLQNGAANEESPGKNYPSIGRPLFTDSDLAPTLDSRSGQSGSHSFAVSGGLVPLAIEKSDGTSELAVRRFTPEECEMLQGFGPGFTKIPWGKKPVERCPDHLRYKAVGLSFPVPVVRWIGQKIEAATQYIGESD